MDSVEWAGCQWFLAHHRACGSSTVYFGPFDDMDEANDFAVEHHLSAMPQAMNHPANGCPDRVWRLQPWEITCSCETHRGMTAEQVTASTEPCQPF